MLKKKGLDRAREREREREREGGRERERAREREGESESEREELWTINKGLSLVYLSVHFFCREKSKTPVKQQEFPRVYFFFGTATGVSVGFTFSFFDKKRSHFLFLFGHSEISTTRANRSCRWSYIRACSIDRGPRGGICHNSLVCEEEALAQAGPKAPEEAVAVAVEREGEREVLLTITK